MRDLITEFDTALDAPVESPTPTVSDPADWQVAASVPVDSEPVASELPWNPLPSDPLPVESPRLVKNPDLDYSVAPISYDVPIDLYPIEPVGPIYSEPKEISVYDLKDPVCNCFAYPCDCDGEDTPVKWTDPLLNPSNPYPIVDDPIITPVVLPIDTPVTAIPPTVDPVSVATQTSTTQGAAGAAADDEAPALIFGYPWYYAAGAAALALLLFSSSDGKR